jgi:hypothetical protein
MVAAGEEERSGHQQSAGIDRQTDRERVVVCVCEGKMAVFKSDENRAKILTWFYFQIKEEDELPKGVCAMCQGRSCRKWKMRTVLRIRMFIPDPNFFHPGSASRI